MAGNVNRIAEDILSSLDDMKHLEDISLDAKKDMGRKIARLRKDAGLRQEDLAKKLGLSRSLVAGWEGANNNVSMGQAIDIARALNCNVSDFVPRDVYHSSKERRLYEAWQKIPDEKKEAYLRAFEEMARSSQ